MSGAGAAIAPIIGMISDGIARGSNSIEQQRRDQRNYEYQKKLNIQGQQLGMKTWEETNYLPQREQMEKAGLNVGMMYGGSGAGGATVSSPSGGSAPHSSAPTVQGGMNAGIGQMMQMGLMEAQKNNIEANTNKTNVETAKLGGEDTEKVRAETENASLRNEYQKILNNVQGMTQEEQIEAIKALSRKGVAEATSAGNEAHVSTNTYNKEIEAKNAESEFAIKSLQDRLIYVKHDAIGKALENALTQAKTRYSQAEIAEIAPRIRKMQAEVSQGWERLSQSERELKIKQFAEELKAEYPSVGQSIGKNINEILRYLEDKSGTESGGRRVDEPRW